MKLTVSARDLFAHMAWADAVVCRAAMASPATAGDAKIAEILQHYTWTQRTYFALWSHADVDFQSFAAEPRDLGSLAASIRKHHAELSKWLAAAEDEQQGQPLVIPWADRLEQRLGRPPGPATVGESMVQVVTHSAHHRGQINSRLRELGVEPPLVDFIAWVWFGKPAAEWAADPHTE